MATKLSKKKPEKKLTKPLPQKSGRGMYGRVTTRHRGGGHKKKLRIIDFKRDKRDISARIEAIEYDPSRTAHIALVIYPDGVRRYILAPAGLKAGDQIIASAKAKVKPGNALPLGEIHAGTFVHNVELVAGKGGQMARSAGSSAQVLTQEGDYVHLRLPSGEIRKVRKECWATVGQVSRTELRSKKLRKAGQKRWRGIRPSVRGVAMDPGSHPHGGGEGRSGIGMPSPKSPWGKKTLGKKTRKKKKSDKYIVKRRK